MRLSRASSIAPVLAVTAVLAGPLVGVASAAPALQSSSPADGALITTAAALPTVVSASYDKALTPPTSPLFPSRISVRLNGGVFNCTAGISADSKTLTCTPFAGVTFSDGTYIVDVTASPSPSTGDTTATHSSFQFTIDTTPPQLNSRVPAAGSRVQSPSTVVATYKENLDTATSTLAVTNSIGNTVGGTAVTTNPTGSSGVVTWTPAASLPKGDYTATTDVTDVHGLHSTHTWSFTVDNEAPAAPTIVAPAFVNAANAHAVPISGSADNTTGNATRVRVTVDDGTTTLTLPDATVGNDGTWSSSPDLSALAEHALTFTAEAVDEAGNISVASAPVTSTKDTVAPTPAPTVNFPAGVTSVNAANPTLSVSGTTEPDAGVAVTATDGTHTTDPATTSAAHSGGGYQAVVDTSTLDDGPLTIAVTATDAAGNTATATKAISKDTVPPGTPTITTFDDVNAANSATPHTMAGTAPTGSTVTVFASDSAGGLTSTITGVPVDGSGNWSTTVPVAGLADGPITAHATAIDGSGNPSAEATKVALKDVGVPAKPAYTPPQWVNIANASTVPLNGTGEPFTTVHLTVTDTGTGSLTKDVPVGGDGQWTTALDLHTFADGALTYAATVVDQTGNESPSQGGVSTKDTVAPGTPAAPALALADGTLTATGAGTTGDTVVTTVASDGGPGQAAAPSTVAAGSYSDPVDVTALADGTLTAAVIETDPAGNSSASSPSATVIKDTTSPLVVSSTTPVDGASVQNAPTLSASYNQQLDLAQSSVTLKDSTGNVLAHNAPTLSADKKTISVSPANNPLAQSAGYQAVFAVKDLSDTDAATTTVTFDVDRAAPAAPAVTSLADATVADVAGVPVSGTAAEPDGTVSVTLGDGTHDVTGSAPVASDGSWATTLDASSLDQGPISATATQTDPAGNESGASAPAAATKDTVAPDAPTVGWSGDASQAEQTVTFSGTGEPGATAHVSVDDADGATAPVGGTALVAGDGTWSEQLDLSSLGDGTLTATAWQVDGVGNTGTTRTADGLKDTVLPAAPTAGFSGPVTVDRPSVTLSGTGESGDLLTLSVDDTDAATQPVTDTVTVSDSLWTTALDLSGLSDGTLTATVSQVDEVGNVSPDGQASGFKDATAPGMPAITTAGPVNAAGAASVPLAGTGTTGDTVKVLVSDDVHPALAATASVTDGAWATSLDLSGLDDGPLTISATDVDAVGNGSSPATLTFAKDTVAPHVALTAPRPAFMLGKVRAAWSGSDGGTGLAAAPYDVRWARGAHAKSLGGYRSLLTAAAVRSTVRSVSAGVTACFQVRAQDAVGNVSGWSSARCSTAALDDRAMSATSRWTRVRDAKLYHGSALVTTVKGQRVVLAASPLRRVALVATHCGRCGVVGVYVGKRLVKIVDLHAVHTRRHVVTILPAVSARTKRVTIRVLSSGEQVVVDGVGTSTR